jgi:cytochrome P450
VFVTTEKTPASTTADRVGMLASDDSLVVLSDDFYQDPHAVYHALRERGPLHRVRLPDGTLGWLVLDYELAKHALTGSEVSKDLETVIGKAAIADGAAARRKPPLSGSVLFSDPPRHTRLRKLVSKAFTGRTIRNLAPRITEIADALLDELAKAESIDLLSRYAYPFSMMVISEMLGVPAQDRDAFRDWSTTMMSDKASAEQRGAAAAAFQGYLSGLINDDTAGSGLISELVAVSEDGDRLDPVELMTMIVVLLIAGHETTVNLIGNAVAELLADRDLLERVSGDPADIAAFVEEVLRFQGPVHFGTLRYTCEPITLAGNVIPAGQLLLVSLAAANHDPERFDAPETVRTDRAANPHIAFGHGLHYCLGAQLARLEANIAITQLLARFPDLALAAKRSDLVWRESLTVRGLVEVPVRLQFTPTEA